MHSCACMVYIPSQVFVLVWYECSLFVQASLTCWGSSELYRQSGHFSIFVLSDEHGLVPHSWYHFQNEVGGGAKESVLNERVNSEVCEEDGERRWLLVRVEEGEVPT